MKKKIKYPLIALIGILAFSLLFYFLYFDLIPNGSNNNYKYDKIPFGYYQDLDMSNYFTYNITEFGNQSNWKPFPEDNAENYSLWSTNLGGQIKIKFSGFFDPSDELDSYNLLKGEKIPYLDIQVLKYESSLLILNLSVSNASNIQASNNFNIGFSTLKSGFIIPYTNMSYIKNLVYEANSSNPNCSGNINIEETYDFIFIGFTQTNAQNPECNLTSYMTYDKHTGLLVRLYAQYGDYRLNMSQIDYTFDISQEFEYKVLAFESSLNITNWFSDSSYGIVKSNPSGRVDVQFIDYYQKNTDDTSVFKSPIPHFDISFIENKTGDGYEDYEIGLLLTNKTIFNISNTELANSMNLGYHNFDSGFFLPTDNLSEIIILAKDQNQSGEWEAEIDIIETNLTIQFNFKKQDQNDNISLIYDKYSGLLQYACLNSTEGPDIEIKITYFNPLVVVKNITLIIVHESGNRDIWANFSLLFGEVTVYDALIKWCEVEYDDYGLMGYLITGIDGDTGNWLYSINNGYVGAAANKVELNNNDIVKWWRI